MNQIDLKDRVAVVTGGAQGIGHATTARLLKSGARVAIWDIDAARTAQPARRWHRWAGSAVSRST